MKASWLTVAIRAILMLINDRDLVRIVVSAALALAILPQDRAFESESNLRIRATIRASARARNHAGRRDRRDRRSWIRRFAPGIFPRSSLFADQMPHRSAPIAETLGGALTVALRQHVVLYR